MMQNELEAIGMIPYNETPSKEEAASFLVVMHEGRMIGWVADSLAEVFVNHLRALKVNPQEVQVPPTLEIAFVPRTPEGQFSGIFLFSAPGRMMRPVRNLATGSVELIGTFEQVYLDVSITKEERYEGITTHEELSETGFLSNLACLIPLPDFNQSPRNMYQCQVNLLLNFLIDYIQRKIDSYRWPNKRWGLRVTTGGTNAVVAVSSYTVSCKQYSIYKTSSI